MSYKVAKKDIEEKHPGENYKSYRDTLLAQTYLVAIRIASAITKASPEKKMQYVAATAVWSAEWEKKLRKVSLQMVSPPTSAANTCESKQQSATVLYYIALEGDASFGRCSKSNRPPLCNGNIRPPMALETRKRRA
jgi:hypothetical protein